MFASVVDLLRIAFSLKPPPIAFGFPITRRFLLLPDGLSSLLIFRMLVTKGQILNHFLPGCLMAHFNAFSRRIYVGGCFYASVPPGIKTSTGINVDLAKLVMFIEFVHI